MPFVAACSFCDTKLKLPDQALGQSRECPRCHNWFTAFEAVKLPNTVKSGRWTRKKKAVAPAESPASLPLTDPPTDTGVQESYERWRRSAPSPAAETTDEIRAHPADDTEPVCESTPSLTAPMEDSVEISDRRRKLSTPSVVAVCCAGTALLAAAVPSLLGLLSGRNGLVLALSPYVNFVALPLAGAGLVACVVGLLLMEERNVWNKGLCVAGGVLGIGILIVLGLWPLLFGPRAIAEAAQSSSQPAIVPFGSTTASPAEWLDASKGRAVQGDLRVRFTDVAVEFIDIKGLDKSKQPKEPSLVMRLRLSNSGVHRRIPYESWADKHPPTLTDDTGRNYALRNFGPGIEIPGHIHTAFISPSKAVDDVLVFEAPAAKFEYLHLELPAAAYGSEGVLRVLIPKNMIRR